MPEHPLADDVALDLVAAAGEAQRLALEERQAGVLPGRVAPGGPRDRVQPAEGEADLDLADTTGRAEQLGDGRGVRRHRSLGHADHHALHQAALHDVQDVSLGDELAGHRVAGAPLCLDELDVGEVAGAVGPLGEVVAPADVGRTAADGVAFVGEERLGDRPAVIDVADDGIDREPDVVEELLAELERAVDLLDRVDLDPGLVDLHDEHREPAVLRRVPVGAGQAHRVVARHRCGAPDLGAVEDPLVAVAIGPGDAPGEIGAAGRLRQELHPLVIAAQERGEVHGLLLVRSVVDEGRAEDAEVGDVEVDRHLVGQRLLGEGALVLDAEPEPAVLMREADAGEPAVPQPALQDALVGPRLG